MIVYVTFSIAFELVVLIWSGAKFPDVGTALLATLFAIVGFVAELRAHKRMAVLTALGVWALFCGYEIWRQKAFYDALPPGYNLKWESYLRMFR
jgi:hypothetical protein